MNTEICLRKTLRWLFSISCTVILFWAGQGVHGAPVTRDLARQVAETQISNVAPAADLGIMSIRDGTGIPLEDPGTGCVLGYVFATQPAGYVVVAADTGIEPVIAFSMESDFSWNEAETNALLHVLRADLDLRLSALAADVVPSATIVENQAAWEQAVLAPGLLEFHCTKKTALDYRNHLNTFYLAYRATIETQRLLFLCNCLLILW